MNNRKSLRFGLLNARSLNTGNDELMVTMNIYTPEILALNETWLKSVDDNSAPVIAGYKFVHKPRRNRRGGGVGFYIKDGINYRIRNHPPSTLEQMWLEVQLPGATMAIGTAYRPREVSVSDALDSISESMHTLAHCTYTCILGDLNIDLSTKDLPKVKELEHFCHQHGLEQLVNEPTRVTDSSETILDVIMTDSLSRVQDVQVLHNRCLSDHAMVIVDFNIKKTKGFTASYIKTENKRH